QLRIASLAFRVQIETGIGVNQPTPLPPTKAPAASSDEEAAAAALLTAGDETVTSPSVPVDAQGVPTGDTVMDKLTVESTTSSPETAGAKAGAGKKEAPKPSGDTSTAAKAILDKYLRRPRQ